MQMDYRDLSSIYADILNDHPCLKISPSDYDFFVVQRRGHQICDPTSEACKMMLQSIGKSIAESPSLSLYVHFPFCREICDFCHYTVFSLTTTETSRIMQNYIDQVIREIELLDNLLGGCLRGKQISSFYFGGGTPGLVSAAELEKLFTFLSSYFRFDGARESTIETIPEVITSARIQVWRRFFDRVSVGVQSLNPILLQTIGRKSAKDTISDPDEVIRRLSILQKAIEEKPFKLNFDLIYGIPGQTYAHLCEDIARIVDTVDSPMSSFTLYRLRLHRGSRYSRLYSQFLGGRLQLPAQEHTYALYYAVSRYLESLGFVEPPSGWFVKGYSLASYEDRWSHRIPLLGCGVSAYSYVGDYEWTNTSNLTEYLNRLHNGLIPWGKYCLLSPTTVLARRFKYRMFFDQEEFEQMRLISPQASAIVDDNRVFAHTGSRWDLTKLGAPLVEEIVNCIVDDGG